MENEKIKPDSLREYDEFGPWIIEITEESMIPRLFCDHYREEGKPELLIKIPRRLERRLASPKTDLYDFMIGAFDTYLLILKRNGRDAQKIKVYYDKITAIKNTHSLLKGELNLFLSDNMVNVNYNTVSDEIIERLVNIIQKKKVFGHSGIVQFEEVPVKYDPKKSGSMDIYLVNITNKVIQADPGMKLVAFQTEVCSALRPDKVSDRIKLLFKVRKHTLTKGSILSDGKELVIVTCDMTARKKSVDRYTYSNTYILIKDITGIRTQDYGLPMISKLQIEVGDRVFEFIFEEKNKSIRNLFDNLKANGSLSVIE